MGPAHHPPGRPGSPLVVVLCKPPAATDCKTRLAADVGRVQAGRIYTRCLEAVLGAAARSGAAVRLAVAGPPLALAGIAAGHAPEAELVRQVGATFAARQRHEIDRGLFDRHRPVAIMASDLAEPPDQAIGWALAAADPAAARPGETAVAIVPAPDGGYSILAAGGPLPELAGVPMSSDRTLEHLRAALRRHGRRVAVAERPLADIDDGADLARLGIVVPVPGEA